MTVASSKAIAVTTHGASDPVVRLAITPTPAHVRTARLVAVAAAREFGADSQLLEEIKLAVSEACTHAIAATRGRDCRDLVGLSISLDGAGEQARITLVVSDHGPYPHADADLASGAQQLAAAGGGASPDASLLLTGMIDDVEIGPGAGGVGTVIRASWPTGAAGQP